MEGIYFEPQPSDSEVASAPSLLMLSSTIAYARFLHALPSVDIATQGYLERQSDRNMILACQRSALIETLVNSSCNVPFYRALSIDLKVIAANPYSILTSLPVISKKTLARHTELFVSDKLDLNLTFKNQTSGSTGVPLTTFHDVGSLVHEAACFRRAYAATPMQPGDRIARIVTDQSRPPWQRQIQLFYGPLDVAIVNLQDRNGSTSNVAIERVLSWLPGGLVGNPSDLLIFAREIQGLVEGLRYVLTGGEILTSSTRSTLERCFNVPVFDTYSMKEVAPVAWQCEAGSLHVDEDRIYMENLKLGHIHELLISNLSNRTQPLLRYRTADMGQFVTWEEEPCACGRALGTLKSLEGRRRGFIVLSDESLFSPKPLKSFLTDLQLDGWQINQTASGCLEVLLDPTVGNDVASVCEKVRSWFLAHLPGRLRVEVRHCKTSQFVMRGSKRQMMNLEVCPT